MISSKNISRSFTSVPEKDFYMAFALLTYSFCGIFQSITLQFQITCICLDFNLSLARYTATKSKIHAYFGNFPPQQWGQFLVWKCDIKNSPSCLFTLEGINKLRQQDFEDFLLPPLRWKVFYKSSCCIVDVVYGCPIIHTSQNCSNQM